MRSKIPIRLTSLSLLILVCLGVQAQTATDYFHGGAQSYLTNNVPGALAIVTNGLQRFPNDQKLQKLYELLNQQQQQQQQDQEQKDEQKQDQQKQDQSQQDQSKNEQPKKDEQNQEEQKDGGENSKGQPEKKEAGDSQQARAMTPQEAKQLLDAQKGEEQVLQFRPQLPPQNRTRKLKDW